MTTADLATAHHCDTCACAPPVPDLNAALQVAATLVPVVAWAVWVAIDVLWERRTR